MSDVLLSFEGVSVYTLSAFVFLAFLWGSFVLYKKAIEYHEDEETVFNLVLLIGVLSFVLARLLFVVTKLDWFAGHWIRVLFVKEYAGMSGWGVFLGILGAVLIMLKKLRVKLFDWLDLIALGLSAGIPIVCAAKGVLAIDQTMSIWGMGVSMISGLLLAFWFFLLWWAESEYRTFEWYRFRKTQAKTGFITGTFIFGFGFINLLVGLLFNSSSVWYVNVLLVAVGSLLVYIRSERRAKKDLKTMVKAVRGLSINKISKWLKVKIKRK